jgi:N-acetylglutamate synthase/N-acetylornithine aminotransferase
VSSEAIGDREQYEALFEGDADFGRVSSAVGPYSGEIDDLGIWIVDTPAAPFVPN